jgi:hypothetical protein
MAETGCGRNTTRGPLAQGHLNTFIPAEIQGPRWAIQIDTTGLDGEGAQFYIDFSYFGISDEGLPQSLQFGQSVTVCAGRGYSVGDIITLLVVEEGVITDCVVTGLVDDFTAYPTPPQLPNPAPCDPIIPPCLGLAEVRFTNTGQMVNGGVPYTILEGWYTTNYGKDSGNGKDALIDVYLLSTGTVTDYSVTNTGSNYLLQETFHLTVKDPFDPWEFGYYQQDAGFRIEGYVSKVVPNGCDFEGEKPTNPDWPPLPNPDPENPCDGGEINADGMITFTDRRALRDGIRNCNLDYNFNVLAARFANAIGPQGPAGPDGVDGTDGNPGIIGIPGPDSGGGDIIITGGGAFFSYTYEPVVEGGGA